jgi:hypothetical protein
VDTVVMQKTDCMCILMKAALQLIKPDNDCPAPDDSVRGEAKRLKNNLRFLKVESIIFYFLLVYNTHLSELPLFLRASAFGK